MASISKQLHFILIPLMVQGHMIPLVDIAKLLARRGVIVTLVTTPQNAARFDLYIEEIGIEIRILRIPFPCQEVGLPINCENLDTLPSNKLLKNFFEAVDRLQEPLEKYLENSHPPPSCIISDKSISWSSRTAQRFGIPRVVFHGMCCFSLLSSYNVKLYNAHLLVDSDTEPFCVPGIPQRIEVTRAQLPGEFNSLPSFDNVRDKMRQAESEAYGVIVNSFGELENSFVEEYAKAIKKKVWCVGPVSLCNQKSSAKYERGNKASIDEKECIEWLDSMKPNSVLYACLGSLCRLVPSQLIEIGLGLEASNQPFIWVVKTEDKCHEELNNWLQTEKFEERTKNRGLVIKGWAPQVLILSHQSIGGFLTHCGWNSTIEGLCNGLPMITWPLFAEQFLNEKLIVEVLKIGVRVGVESAVRWGDEHKVGVLVTSTQVKKAIDMLMNGGGESALVRERAKEVGEMAVMAMEEGGSSYLNMSLFIEDIMYQSIKK